MTVDSARGADINDLSTLILGEASRLAAREFFDWANKQQVRYEVSLVSVYTTLTLCFGHDCYPCAFRSYEERKKSLRSGGGRCPIRLSIKKKNSCGWHDRPEAQH